MKQAYCSLAFHNDIFNLVLLKHNIHLVSSEHESPSILMLHCNIMVFIFRDYNLG